MAERKSRYNCKTLHCIAPKCFESTIVRSLCKRHYAQLLRYGKVLERTVYDPNTYRVRGPVVHIDLYNVKRVHIKTITADIEDLDLLKTMKLTYSAANDAVTTKPDKKGPNINLARIIMKAQKNDIVRFASEDRMNFMKRNLVVESDRTHVNRHKKKINKNNTSGHKGVSWSERHGGWLARLQKKGEVFDGGIFTDKADAVRARRQLEEEHWDT